MALSNAERDRVAELLSEHPEWRTGQIREAAGLHARQLFAVKKIRGELGVPEPDTSGTPKKPRRLTRKRGRPSSSRAAGGPTADDLLDDDPAGAAASADEDAGDDDADLDSVAGGRAGGPRLGRWKRASSYKSVLAPAMPQFVKSGALGLMQQSGKMTRNPMEPAEALGVVAPIARIGDRVVARYVRVGNRQMDPNTADLIAIVFAVALYLLRLIVDTQLQKQPPSRANTTARAPGYPSPGPGPALNVTMPADDAGDDLFAGSEPVAMGAAAIVDADEPPRAASRRPATREGAQLAREGIAGPMSGPVDDTFWNAITPTNLGNYEAP